MDSAKRCTAFVTFASYCLFGLGVACILRRRYRQSSEARYETTTRDAAARESGTRSPKKNLASLSVHKRCTNRPQVFHTKAARGVRLTRLRCARTLETS